MSSFEGNKIHHGLTVVYNNNTYFIYFNKDNTCWGYEYVNGRNLLEQLEYYKNKNGVVEAPVSQYINTSKPLQLAMLELEKSSTAVPENKQEVECTCSSWDLLWGTGCSCGYAQRKNK